MHLSAVTEKPNAWSMRLNLLLAVALCSVSAIAQAAIDASPLILDHLTMSDGLPQGTVLSTLQDSQGFVWLGTQDGLVRYDGQTLVRYAHSPGVLRSLPGNFIYQIIEDGHKDLWVAIKDGGVARWNRGSDSFTVFRHSDANPGSLASDAVRAVMLDASGRLWIGTGDAGIDILSPATGKIAHLRHDPLKPDSLIDDRIFSLTTDRSGSVWIGTAAGLDRQNKGGGFDHFRHSSQDPHSLSSDQISQVLEDKTGVLWVATYDGGLNRMDRDGGVVQVFRHDAQRDASLSNDDVRALLEDQAGHLWVGTVDGLNLLDRAGGSFVHYVHQESDAGSLRDSTIVSLYEDSSGLVWIGTLAGGVSRWNPRSWDLGGHRPNWLGGKLVSAFADAPENKVWIASVGGGLVQYDGSNGAATDIDTLVGRRNALGDLRVMALREDHAGALWIGTMTGGLHRLAGGHLESIPVRAGDPRSLSDGGIMAIVEARNGDLWIGTHDGGANVLDPHTGLVRQLPFGPSIPGAVSAPGVTAIAEDLQGNFWIGTDGGGLNLARADGLVLKVFRHDPNDPASLPANTVYAISVDTVGRVWLGTDSGGLVQIMDSAAAPDSVHFRVVSRAEGLSGDTVYGVLNDAAGNLWLSGNAGLMRFDPESRVVKTFHREHGLQGEEFDNGAYFRLRDGRLCFGGPGGFNIFDPARLSEDRRPPRLALTRIEVMGVPVTTTTPPWLLGRIVVDHRASIISMDFGALDFVSPKRNRLEYRMAGLTDQWIDVGSQHRITLTSLGAGDHRLEVRAANADSVWSETPLRLTIYKEPAPWNSPWAYAVYVLAALALLAYRLRLQRTKFRRVVAARERLETEVALRTRELVESNRQLAEAARAKSNFLDRMSHELRTPMNGVVGMTELLARTPLSSAQTRLTDTIRTSAGILLQIVNDLLDLSKIQAGKVQLESLPIDLTPLLEGCTSLFMGSAATKGIELILCPTVQEHQGLLGDPQRLQQILMNLIGNAVKFTAQGEVVVKADILSAAAGYATLQVTVSDTGVGMDQATIAKIFEPFTQADESTSRRFGGSGLGLAICRELAELLGGTILASSTPKVGSTFTLTVPLKMTDGESNSIRTPSLPSRSVRILSRRPALAEALARTVVSLGLSVLEDGEITILDAGTYAESLRPCMEASRRSGTALVIVASTAEAESADLAALMHPDAVVAKPVHRDALYAALSTAILGPVSAGVATPFPTLDEAAIGGHVLLVEDEAVNAAVAEGYLAELGCTCVWVETGSAAVARSTSERFDLILMDLSMPAMDGFATTHLIRQSEAQSRRVPIVALTAYDAAGYRKICIEAGMDDLLSKPYTFKECAQMLRLWIPSDPARADLSIVDPVAVASLRNLRGGKQTDLYSRLVDLFRVGSAKSMNEIRCALLTGDLKTAGSVCHKLASSAANVGALAFANGVRRLGILCSEGDTARAAELQEGLQAAYGVLIEGLMRVQCRKSA